MNLEDILRKAESERVTPSELLSRCRVEPEFEVLKSHEEEVDGQRVTAIDDARLLGASLVRDTRGIPVVDSYVPPEDLTEVARTDTARGEMVREGYRAASGAKLLKSD